MIIKYFGSKGPTREQCNKEVGRDHKGEPITRAMQLGVEQHQMALDCAQKRLAQLKPGAFSIKPRYRRNARTGHVEYVPDEEVRALLSQGRGSELIGTIEPDIVVHAGAPHQIQAVYDFKFPCVNGGQPRWRDYPEGHPYQGRSQVEMYTELLGVEPMRVVPRYGVIR